MNATAEAPSMEYATQQLAAELWISLASLLRSHVAMHSIARPNGALRIVSSSDTALELLGGYGKLSLLAPTASGIGATEFRPEAGELGDEYAGFSFTEDGLIRIDDLEDAMEIEAAVEHWIRKVNA